MAPGVCMKDSQQRPGSDNIAFMPTLNVSRATYILQLDYLRPLRLFSLALSLSIFFCSARSLSREL